MIRIDVDDTLENADWVKSFHDDSGVSKARVYLRPGQKAPEGREEKTGLRGGRYYETKRDTPRYDVSPGEPSPTPKKESAPIWERQTDPDWWIDSATPDDFAEFFMFEDLFAVTAVTRQDDDGDDMGLAVVHVGLFNKQGEQVASLERQFEPGGNVNNAIFEIDPRYQDSGLGSRFSEEMEKRYMAAGFKTVTLSADIDVGKYIWALIGYDFQEEDQKEAILSDLVDFVADRIYEESDEHEDWMSYYQSLQYAYGEGAREVALRAGREAKEWLATQNIDHAWDVAALDDGKEYGWETKSRSGNGRLGKALLLRTLAWDGIKRLDPEDDGFRIGQAYYAAKNRSSLNKTRVYLRPGMQPPLGVEVEVGPRGGRYYEAKQSEGLTEEEVSGLLEEFWTYDIEPDADGFTFSFHHPANEIYDQSLSTARVTNEGEITLMSPSSRVTSFQRNAFTQAVERFAEKVKGLRKPHYDDDSALGGREPYVPDWDEEDRQREERDLPVWERHTDPEWWANEAETKDFEELFSFGKYKAECLSSPARGEWGTVAMMVVRDENGRGVARMNRTFKPDGEIHHDLFTATKTGAGFGVEASEIMEERYASMGFTRITLNADIDVGKYTWAQIGYDFDDLYEIPDIEDSLREFLRRHYNVSEEEEGDPKQDISDLQEMISQNEAVIPSLERRIAELREEAEKAAPYPIRANELPRVQRNLALARSLGMEVEFMEDEPYGFAYQFTVPGDRTYLASLSGRLMTKDSQDLSRVADFIDRHVPEVPGIGKEFAQIANNIRRAQEDFELTEHHGSDEMAQEEEKARYRGAMNEAVGSASDRFFVSSNPYSSSAVILSYPGAGISLHLSRLGQIVAVRGNSQMEGDWSELAMPSRSATSDLAGITSDIARTVNTEVTNYDYTIQGHESMLEERKRLNENYREQIRNIYERLSPGSERNPNLDKIEQIIQEFPFDGHAWEWAAFDNGDRFEWDTYTKNGESHLGKAFMLSPYMPYWNGIKYIGEDAGDGWEVGKRYYQAKKNKKAKAHA